MSKEIRDKVLSLLSTVQDPHTGQPLTNGSPLAGVEINDTVINISIAIDKVSAEIKNNLNFACLSALYNDFPEYQVNVHFVNPEKNKSTNPLPHVKNIIAVASGKGGVGKSTVSANLAVGLKQAGYKVGLMDADLYGPSMPTMFNLSNARPKMTKVHNQPKIVPIEKDDLYMMSIGFVVEPEQAVVLRGPRLGGIIKQFITECLWPELDYLIIDLPPGTGDIQLTLVQSIPLTAAIIVSTPQELAVVDAIKAANMFLLPNINIPLLGVVENMSWFTPAELPNNKYYLFGKGGGEKLSALFETPVLGQIPLIQSIGDAADRGNVAIADSDSLAKPYFESMVDNVVRYLKIRNETQPASSIVEIKN